MINEHSFYEKDFDLEKYIENSVKLNELELIRVDLEKCYKNIKNTATSTTGENIEKFFNLENKEFRADFDDILIELKDTNTKIAAMLNDTNEEINKINDILHQQHAITDEKMKCIFALKIIEYNEFLTNFASTYVEQEYELLEKILDDNNQVIICAEILIELHSFPKYDQIPQILRDTCFKLNGETVLKIEEKLDHIFIRHLQKLINYITNLYGFLIDTEIYQEVENTLNRFNHIFRAKTMENCFLTIFDKIIDTNNGIDEIFDQTLQLILSPMSIYHRIITSTVKFNWKFDILTNSLIFSLYSHLNKYYYVLNDPDSFHVSFCKVNLFLQTIENLFYRPDQIKSFRKHEHIINLLKKWNISTYFQTRRRFIITKIEMSLKEFESRLTGFTSDPPKLFETATEMLKYCFDANVILPQLVGRFWGLFLQINYIVFNRIQTYFESNIFNFDSLDGIVLFQNSINFYENNLMNILELDVKNFLVNNLILKFSTIERLKPDILKSVDKLKFYFDELIIKILVEKIIPLLEETKNVPRLYRNTNRDVTLWVGLIHRCQLFHVGYAKQNATILSSAFLESYGYCRRNRILKSSSLAGIERS